MMEGGIAWGDIAIPKITGRRTSFRRWFLWYVRSLGIERALYFGTDFAAIDFSACDHDHRDRCC